jgi:hypothetical protein
MSLLRVRYLQGLFRWEPHEVIDRPGEADTWEFYSSDHLEEAWAAAMCLELEWTREDRDWVEAVHDNSLAVAVEQCCHDGRLMPCELRALRLQRFDPSTAYQAEHMLQQLPGASGDTPLRFLWWQVRIERSGRTGCPDLDPARRPVVIP